MPLVNQPVQEQIHNAAVIAPFEFQYLGLNGLGLPHELDDDVPVRVVQADFFDSSCIHSLVVR